MTRRTNARLAGVTFLLYIAVALPANILFANASGTGETAAKLASLAQNASDVRITVVLSLLAGFEVALALWLIVKGVAEPVRR